MTRAVAGERRVVVAEDAGRLWLGLVVGHRVHELVVLSTAASSRLGAIYKGRVTGLAPGISAVFVEAGLERELFTPCPEGGAALEMGQELLVQIVREAGGGKGHRASLDLTLPGWALILAPGGGHRGVSRKIRDHGKRERLRMLLEEIAPAGCGLIARTAAADLTRELLVAELDALVRRWQAVLEQSAQCEAPALLFREEEPILSFLRDQLCQPIAEVIVEDAALLARLVDLVEAELPGAALTLRAHSGSRRLVEAYGLDLAWAEASARSLRLPSGGRVIIEPTEALVAIDVNSGRDTGGAHFEETALRTNIEAAELIARQICLRDLGGLIVIDFIDMLCRSSRALVDQALKDALAEDRSKHRILTLSEFCLAQISRQRRAYRYQ